mgnify:CR=1 FL=1
MNEDWVIQTRRSLLCEFEPYFGSEQGGTRPVLVLQNNMGNFFLSHLIVAPLTSKWIKKRNSRFTILWKRSRAGPEIGCSVRTNQND